MLLALFILILSVYLGGPYGVGIFLVIMFGFIFSIYQKTKLINEDLKLIKGKLGLLNEDPEAKSEMEGQ